MRPVTDIPIIDRTCRLLPGELYFLVGRWSGEDWLATRIAHHNALRLGGRVVVMSLEQARSRTLEGLAAIEARRNVCQLRQRDSADQAWIDTAEAAVADAPITVVGDDTAHATAIFETYHRARELGGIDLLVVTSLDALASHTDCIYGSHTSVIGRVRLLKTLAEHFGAPVVVVARARRRCDQRRLLRASDIRGGARLARMADGVILVRPDPMPRGDPMAWSYYMAADERTVRQHATSSGPSWTAVVQQHCPSDYMPGSIYF